MEAESHSLNTSETLNLLKTVVMMMTAWNSLSAFCLFVLYSLISPPLTKHNLSVNWSKISLFIYLFIFLLGGEGGGLQEGLNHAPLTPPQARFIPTLNVDSCNLWVAGECRGARGQIWGWRRLTGRLGCSVSCSSAAPGQRGYIQRGWRSLSSSVPPLVWRKLSRVSISSVAFPAGA